MDCCFGKFNDLKQTQSDCAAILENAMTLTALLPAKLCSSALWRSKSLLILKNHISQSTADPLGSLFKGTST